MPVVYSSVEGIPRFQSGIGDAQDLRVQVREHLDGGWYPVLYKGFYYLGTEEQYLYAQKGSQTFSVASTSIQTAALTGLTTDPTSGGPIRVFDGSGTQLLRVCSPLRAFRQLTLAGDSLLSGSTSGLLLSVVSHAASGIYLQVPASGDIVSNEDYAYDPYQQRLYLKDASPPTLFITYLVEGTDAESLKQEEIVQVDPDGKVRVQYSGVSMAAGQEPLIRKPTPAGGVSTTATAASGNVLTFTAGGITSGDLVAVEYYVQNSFTATFSGSTLTLTLLPGSTGSYTAEYETGDQLYDPSQLAEGATNRIQLNPLYTPRESGFLYLIDAAESGPNARRVRIALDDPNPVTDGYGPFRRGTVTVFDGEDNPLPGVVVTLTAPSSAASGLPYYNYTDAINRTTDARGQLPFLYAPATSGTVTLSGSVTVSGTTYRDTQQLFVRNLGDYLNPTHFELGKLLLHLESVPYRDSGELYRLNAYYCFPDGAPYQPAGEHDPYGYPVTFTTERSRFASLDGSPLHDRVTVATGDDSIASVLITPVPGDVIRASLVTEDSTGAQRTRTARPLRIPEESDHG